MPEMSPKWQLVKVKSYHLLEGPARWAFTPASPVAASQSAKNLIPSALVGVLKPATSDTIAKFRLRLTSADQQWLFAVSYFPPKQLFFKLR